MSRLLLMLSLLVSFQNLLSQQFTGQVIDDGVSIGYGLAIGDVDGDGLDDIILADKKAFVWYQNPNWDKHVIIENLTERDNVCLAARDINNDGKVEIAVGAQWNPGETSDPAKSGSVHVLEAPADPREKWTAHQLPHEPTVHRMHWAQTSNGYQLVVLPLHGRDNVRAMGKGVRIYGYAYPGQMDGTWEQHLLDSSMHLTHNFDILPGSQSDTLLIGGKEGSIVLTHENGAWKHVYAHPYVISDTEGFGEIRKGTGFIAGIQPFHGNSLNVHVHSSTISILNDLAQGHALACGDILQEGSDQIIVGWREPNEENEMGIKLIKAVGGDWNNTRSVWIDKNEMACEDLKIADLNKDGLIDIIAAGRSTNNLKIYWNQGQ